MSFYGQVIQQIQGAISKIIVKKDADSKTEITSAVTLQGDGVIYPDISDNTTITLTHKTLSGADNEYDVLMQDYNGVWRKGTLKINASGHAKLTVDENSTIAVLTVTDDNNGNITFS